MYSFMGGASFNVHVSLLMKDMLLSVAAGRCMYSWVGWGGVGHVHVILLMKDLLFLWLLLQVLPNFPLMRHATLL